MRRLSVALLGILVLAVFAAGGNAKVPPPLGVSFVVPTTYTDKGGDGPFIASGFAVDAGVMCPAGSTEGLSETASPSGGNAQGVNFFIVKRFTCSDGSGRFDVKLTVRLNKNGDNFNWTVIGGTDNYESLHGSGQGYGIYPTPPQTTPDVTDYYFGTVRL